MCHWMASFFLSDIILVQHHSLKPGLIAVGLVSQVTTKEMWFMIFLSCTGQERFWKPSHFSDELFILDRDRRSSVSSVCASPAWIYQLGPDSRWHLSDLWWSAETLNHQMSESSTCQSLHVIGCTSWFKLKTASPVLMFTLRCKPWTITDFMSAGCCEII